MLLVELDNILRSNAWQQTSDIGIGVGSIAQRALIGYEGGHITEGGEAVLDIVEHTLTSSIQIILLHRHLTQQRVDGGKCFHRLVGLGTSGCDVTLNDLRMLGKTGGISFSASAVGQRTELANILEED